MFITLHTPLLGQHDSLIDTIKRSRTEDGRCYKEVSVLLLSWDEGHDDLGVKVEVDALAAMFRDRFRFQVQSSLLEIQGK